MYAVFKSGGKQYRASKGDRLKVEKLDADEGARVSFDEVLLVGAGKDIRVGSPLVDGTAVNATVVSQGRSGKIGVTKFRRRQNYLRQHTHRQWFTEVEIISISGVEGGEEEAPEAKAAAPKKKAPGKKTAKKKAASKKVGKKKTAAKASGKKASKKTSKKTSS